MDKYYDIQITYLDLGSNFTPTPIVGFPLIAQKQ